MIEHTLIRSGIGFATAHALYQRGAKVYLAVRNKDKATSSIKRLEESKKEGSGQAIFLHLDLDDPKGVKASAEEFMKLEDRLDILSESPLALRWCSADELSVNNAAM